MSAAYALAIISILPVSWSLRLSDAEDDVISSDYEKIQDGLTLHEASSIDLFRLDERRLLSLQRDPDWWKHETKTCRDHLPKSSIYHGEKPRPVEKPRAALFAVLVQASDHQKEEDMVEDGLAMFRSSDKQGQTLEKHLIAANLSASDTERFENAGIVVHNFTDKMEEAKSWYRPVYNRKGADAEGRLFLDGIPVQSRKDGWATYFKFLSWAHTDFDVILFTDLDSRFFKNHDALVSAFGNSEVPLITCPEMVPPQENPNPGYLGFNSHRMLLRPSKVVSEQLARKASEGNYIPFTNTEQDVLECYFDVKSSLAGIPNMPRLC